MKSTSLILSAAALFSAVAATAADNYSLWPRRPAELQQARSLMAEKKGAEAAHLLSPFLKDAGIAGREARQLVAAVNTPRYLTRQHPAAFVYTVQSGDTVQKIAKAQQCPADIVMLLNGLVEPGGLRIGQKLVLTRMTCRILIDLKQREVSVWDGETLVADYAVLTEEGAAKVAGETTLAAREGSLEGTSIPAHSTQFTVADHALRLENGLHLSPEKSGVAPCIRLNQRDLNELTQLVAVGCPVQLLP